MVVEETKHQLLLLQDQLQEVAEAKCLHQGIQVAQVVHLLQEVTLVAEVHQEEVAQEDSVTLQNTKALKKISAFFISNW